MASLGHNELNLKEISFRCNSIPGNHIATNFCTSGVMCLTHWPLGDLNEIGNFQANFDNWWLGYHLWNCPQVIFRGPQWWWISIGLGNGLAPSGNKPLPEPMLTQIYVAIWHHLATTSWYGEGELICLWQRLFYLFIFYFFPHFDVWIIMGKHTSCRFICILYHCWLKNYGWGQFKIKKKD